MPTNRSRISAGILLGCVLAIACASALGRDSLQEGAPRTVQYEECQFLIWGENQQLKEGPYFDWPAGNQIKQNYTACEGYDHAINITWDAHAIYPSYVNVTIGTTLIARNGSGTILIPYGQLPADKENITLTNDNGTSIGRLDYGIYLQNQYPTPQLTSDIPMQGGGVAMAIAYAAVIILGIASFKLPQKVRILVLIGNVVMPVMWFGGLAFGKVTPASMGSLSISIGPGTFHIPEGGGLVISAAIDFDISDPYYLGFEYTLFKGDWMNDGVPVYSGEFGVGSGFAGYESETKFLPLPPGDYSLMYTSAPSPRMEVGFYPVSAWSDICPTTSIGMWRWAFLIIGICAAALTMVAIVKNKTKGKTTKIIPKPAMQGAGGVIDVPFATISSSTVTAPTGPVTPGPVMAWVCETCGKANEDSASFCIGCGTARRAA